MFCCLYLRREMCRNPSKKPNGSHTCDKIVVKYVLGHRFRAHKYWTTKLMQWIYDFVVITMQKKTWFIARDADDVGIKWYYLNICFTDGYAETNY